jgi:hypothetical protein
MSGGDRVIHGACGAVMTRPLTDRKSLLARRAVLQDALAQEEALGALLKISDEAVDSVRAHLKFAGPKYDRVIPNQKKIITETEIAELNLKHLLSEGLKQADVLLYDLWEPTPRGKRRPRADEIPIPLSSIALIQNAEEIVESALTPVYRTLAGWNRSMQRFFEKLRFQAGFFVGCVNLRRQLEGMNVPLCDPEIAPVPGEYAGESLIDPSLALKERRLPAANGFRFTGKRRVVITGPNQGGKTTFLRSVGLAQVMAQCGMFVAARTYTCPLFSGIYSHFPGAEDDRLQMGLLEAELRKMSGIIGAIKPGGLLLMNESFQTTMPLDAKRLCEEIVSALVDAGVTVLFVTHLYAFALELFHELI